MKKNLLFGLILFVASAGFAFGNDNSCGCNCGCDACKCGSVVETIELKDVVPAALTTKPVLLPEGTDGSYGTKGTYVLFGDWPQTVKANDVKVAADKEVVNGWECYKGSDGFYYVKAEADTVDYYEFDNEKSIEDGEEYYFKLEPIKWRVVTDEYKGGKLLVAENILFTSYFYSVDDYDWENRTINGETVYKNNYNYSTVRAYLNGLDGSKYNVEDFTGKGFINKAFTKEAMESINTVSVDNRAKSTGYSDNGYACENTEDKIFLLSVAEVTRSSYGFESDGDEIDDVRKRSTTDYSRATGAYSDKDSWSSKGKGKFWLRSPHYTDRCGTYVDEFGQSKHSSYSQIEVNESGIGVVPALSISF